MTANVLRCGDAVFFSQAQQLHTVTLEANVMN